MTNIISSIHIAADQEIDIAKLIALSKQCRLPMASSKISSDYLLYQSKQRLELRCVKDKKVGAVYADFVMGKAQHRRLYGGGKKQHIAKAVGLSKYSTPPTVLDVTAGFGRDAFVLAYLGCQLTLLERCSVVHALVKDALQRGMSSLEYKIQEVIARMTLHQVDAFTYLQELRKNYSEEMPDVIYLDPMFPERSKSAYVKKEMQFFHDIAGSDSDSDQLLDVSRCCAKKRIVVKRPRLGRSLNNTTPNFVIVGKSIRYDVYLPY